MAVCATVVGGCSRTIGGIPTTADTVPTTTVAGLPVTDGPSGPKPGVPDATIPVENTDGGEMDTLAANAVADIQTYWKQAFPTAFGKKFTPVKRFVSYDSTAPGMQLCGQSTSGAVNAFYCPLDDSVSWDRARLLPKLDNSFGPMAVVTVLAHEMGHAVQQRANDGTEGVPTIVLEQKADCFTGAFFRHVAEGAAKHFRISTGPGLNKAMGVLNYIRDTPGKTGFTGENAHGSSFDRISAFQHGFDDGPRRCAEMTTESIKRRTTQFRFWKDSQETDLPINRDSATAVERSLREVFGDTGAAPPEITTSRSPCGGGETTSPASYCPETNTVSLDVPALRRVAQPPSTDKRNSGYGDFAAYAQVASRYALSVQKAAGLPLDGKAAGLRTACLVGSWSGLLVEDPIGQRNPVGKLRIAPGDIDEGTAALLGDDSLIAADVDGDQVPAGFARVEAFRVGFQQGMSPCTTKYGK
ncbi:putative metalloprotease [Saccharopolyspora lacisalsi]|uniref:Putative metalloprotease n=1 Tax=Halosaccharopolyspora lacisalsi TaxID=1000566 RepID=A0A839E0G2_9PSEU|nr:neutral zinc metallopeptidase [Halosaccharopolyspora lacisalsi]MBA8825237.1 putative metalloprotease [Halosaccharopolyspora lacisalsi]